MVQDARLAQRAGVVLTMKDWKKMGPDERAAWLAARELEGAQVVTDPPAESAPPAEVHSELVAAAARIANGKG